LQGGLKLMGQATGKGLLETHGALSDDNVILIDLTNQIPDLGPVHLLIIPNIAVPYTYNANVGETFTLEASIEGNVNNSPLTGASVTVGVPLLEVVELVNTVTGGQVGDVLKAIVDAVAAQGGLAAAKPLVAKAAGTTVTILSTSSPTATPKSPC